MPALFTDKVALVTGSSRGIGADIALTLARQGASVIVNYSGSQSAAEDVVSRINSAGGQAIAVQADVSSPEQVAALFDAGIARFGKIDFLVNNAGIAIFKLLQDTTTEDLDRILDINVKGTFNTLRQAATRLQDGGRIVNFSSTVTRLLMPTYAAYSASKAAVEQLTRVFAKEIGNRGITVNSISPGPTHTELFNEGKTPEVIQRLASMTALGRIGEVEDITRVVLFLLSDAAAWVTAQNLGANGGFA